MSTYYDPSRGVVGVIDQRGLAMEWDGEVWSHVSKVPAGFRATVPVVRDTARDRLVVPGFGEARENYPDWHSEWLEYDGARWLSIRSPLGPYPRTGTCAAYDPIAREMILLGGIYSFRRSPSGYSILGDTWSYDGTGWAYRGYVGSRFNAQMAFDSARGVMVMMGGRTEGFFYQEVWERAPHGEWQLRGTQMPMEASPLFYDPRRRQVFVTGAGVPAGAISRWYWNGHEWVQGEAIVQYPLSEFFLGSTYDQSRDTLILVGTVDRRDSVYYATSRLFEIHDGRSIEMSPREPIGRTGAAMVWDQARNQGVLFGGYVAENSSPLSGGPPFRPDASTWTYQSGSWTEHVTPSPPQRMTFAMCYDLQRQRTVVFGGRQPPDNSFYYNDTWEWDGSTWTQRQVQGPSARARMTMAYDRRRGVSVLFGGYALPSTVLADTWEWNGTTWTQRPIPGPPARYRHSMAYDESRGVIVLFGGLTAAGVYLGETWEYDGLAWTRRSTTGPEPRTGAQIEYDSVRRLVVIWGGANATTGLSDTWEWDGASWTPRTDIDTLVPKNYMAHAFDRSQVKMIGFGGSGSSTSVFPMGHETWTLGSPCPAPVFQSQPADTNAAYFGSATFSVDIQDDGSTHRYQWRRGEPPVFIDGATSPTLTIEHATIADLGPYDCIVTADGNCFRERVVSRKATLSICLGDFDGDGQILVADYAAYINAYEAGDAPADFNGDGFIDFFDHDAFVEAYETGC